MRYLRRDPATGALLGHFANLQPGIAEEAVADDHADIVAWEQRRSAMKQRPAAVAELQAQVAELRAQVAQLMALRDG